ncbi:hypothetical protein ABZU75_30385 [Streptosporangium sp. NPDC005286]|uniref:hypothetical protein n=1 Tax=Streptosporangium sp. NPDC005286 TaxID=3154463 RepID=UPI0033B71834
MGDITAPGPGRPCTKAALADRERVLGADNLLGSTPNLTSNTAAISPLLVELDAPGWRFLPVPPWVA